MNSDKLPPNRFTRERFETSFAVASYESDFNGRLSLFSLFNRFQELAGLHARYLNVGYDMLHHANLAWFLSRIRVQLNSLPQWGDIVTLATWPKGKDRLFALRDFSLTNERGEVLVLATTAWLVFDTVKNRPQRIDTLLADLRFEGAPHAIQGVPEKIQPPTGLAAAGQRVVVLSDLDANGHVNNAHYAKWVCDCFPREQFRRRQITSMQINYLEEVLEGDTIDLLTSSVDETVAEYCIIGKNTKTGATLFQALTAWR